MALKILLADDSMTAQNLGKKILTEAGYDVIAVSNGAAAVKKIAAEKPSLIILDVYMPGYSGLEVCERVKAAAETSSIPVLLTVGKMEPYQPEDGNRVKADGVMIKPFEASDLLAAVERFAQPAAAAAAAVSAAPKTIKMPVLAEPKESEEAWKTEPAVEERPAPKPVAMPADVASAPAFGFDDIPPAPSFGLPVEPVPASGFEFPPTPQPAPAFDMPVVAEPAPSFDMAPNAAEPAPSFGLVTSDDTPTVEITVPPEIEYNAAPAVEVSSGPAPELEASGTPTPPETPVAADPSLVANTDTAIADFVVKVGSEHPEEMPVGIAYTDESESAPESASPETGEETAEIPAIDATPAPSFETSPAIDSYVAPEPPVAPPAAASEGYFSTSPSLSLQEEMRRAFSSVPEPPMPPQAAAAAAGAGAETPVDEIVDVSRVAAATGMDEDKVAQALDRVMERFKGQLVSEIVRELKKS